MGKTIKNTIERDLCVSCGLCKAICPNDCINSQLNEGQFLPEIYQANCINCDKCYNTCPGIEVDYPELYEQRGWEYPKDIYSGQELNSYITYIKDKDLHFKASSGGLVSQILIHLIENDKYDKAFVVDCDLFSGEEVKSTPALNREKIISAAKSKYLPVSIELVAEEIKKNPEDKIVVVGTSCHFHGLLKFIEEENLSTDNILFLGLFCEKTLNLNIFDYYKDNYGEGNDKMTVLNYRNKGDNGWPGNSKIEFESGREKYVDRKVRIWLKPYFQLNRCLFCLDKLNQFADISFGDCYIPGEESQLGKSNIIIRSKKGQQIFDSIKSEVEYKKVDISKIKNSQGTSEKIRNYKFDILSQGKNINYIKDQEVDFDRKKLLSELKSKQKNIKVGQNYTNNREKIKKHITRKKMKSILRLPKRLLIKILTRLNLKEPIKNLMKG